jgi:hypothetical protein
MARIRLRAEGDWIFGRWFGGAMSKIWMLAAGIGYLKLVFERDAQNWDASGRDWGFEACF